MRDRSEPRLASLLAFRHRASPCHSPVIVRSSIWNGVSQFAVTTAVVMMRATVGSRVSRSMAARLVDRLNAFKLAKLSKC